MKKDLVRVLNCLVVVNYNGSYNDDYNDEIVINNQLALIVEDEKYKIVFLKGDRTFMDYIYENVNFELTLTMFNSFDSRYKSKFEKIINCYDGYFFTPYRLNNIDITILNSIIKG